MVKELKKYIKIARKLCIPSACFLSTERLVLEVRRRLNANPRLYKKYSDVSTKNPSELIREAKRQRSLANYRGGNS